MLCACCYLGDSRSAERKARMTSSRLFSLISSSAKRVGRSSVGNSTGLSLKKLGAGRGAGLAATGAMRGGTVGRAGAARPPATRGGGEPRARGAAGGRHDGVAQLLRVVRLHAGDDVPAQEQMRDVVRVRKAGVLRLHVVHARSVLDVVVEPHPGGAGLRSRHVLLRES